ncbi:MAG: hypothetical protein L0Z71_01975 [Anaerolineae bacterium]|nr:hypothetical protein [Anaerolineae bacterium]
MPIVLIVILGILAFALVPFTKRAEDKNAFLEAWSKEIGKKKQPKFSDIIRWLLVTSVAIMAAILIGAGSGL